jgi:hypothetical protein
VERGQNKKEGKEEERMTISREGKRGHFNHYVKENCISGKLGLICVYILFHKNQ